MKKSRRWQHIIRASPQALRLLVIGFYRLAERAQDRHIGTFSYGLLWQCAGCDPCLWQTFPPVPCALAPATVAKSAKAIIMIFISSLLVRAQASMRRPGSSSGHALEASRINLKTIAICV